MKVLVLNSGSSSIKYKMFGVRGYVVVASGLLECIGGTESRLDNEAVKELQEENK